MAKVYVSSSDKDLDRSSRIMDWLRFQDYDPISLSQQLQENRENLSQWHREITQAQEGCDLVILVLTQDWLDSKWCFAEFTNAYSVGKTIFAIIEEPLDNEFSEPGISVFDLTHDREAGLSNLAVALRDALLSSSHVTNFNPDRIIYPGLQAYQEEDSAVFFSRDDDIRRIIDRLNIKRRQGGERLLALLGAPGTGMSSLLKGGVIPRLQKDQGAWIVLPVMRPYFQPIEEFSKAVSLLLGNPELWEEWAELFRGSDFKGVARELAEQLRNRFNIPDAHILLPVDQGEELFSISNREDAEQFLDILGAIFDDDMPYVGIVALRPDFLQSYQTADQLSHIVEEFSPRLLPLSSIRQIITGPSEYVNLDIEEELVERILSDALEDGALPVVSYLLNYLYRNMSSEGGFTLRAYEEIGNQVTGRTPLGDVIGKVAEEIFATQEVTEVEADDLREVFLTRLLWSDTDNRIIIRPADLSDFSLKARVIIRKFIDAGLMVSREVNNVTMVEYTHLAIVDNWPRLKAWVHSSGNKYVEEPSVIARPGSLETNKLEDESIQNTSEAEEFSPYRFSDQTPDQDNFIDEAHKYVQAEILSIDGVSEEEDRFSRPPNIFSDREGNTSGSPDKNEERDGYQIYNENTEDFSSEIEVDYQANNIDYEDLSQNKILAPKPIQAVHTNYKSEKKSKAGIAAVIIFIVACVSLGAIFWSAIEKQIFEPTTRVVENEQRVLTNPEKTNEVRTNNSGSVSQEQALKNWPLLRIYKIVSELEKVDLSQKEKDKHEIELMKILRQMQSFQPLIGHSAQVSHVTFSPNGLYLASTSNDHTIRIWDIMTGKTEMVFEGHTARVNSVAFSEDSKQLLTSSDDKTVKIWDVVSGKPVKSFDKHSSSVNFAVYRPFVKEVVTATNDGNVYLWDIEKGSIIRELKGHKGAVKHLAVSSNGSWLASASQDNTARIWDLVSGQNMVSIVGHKAEVNTVQFSNDDSSILTSSKDGAVGIWQTFSGKQEQFFSVLEGELHSASFHSDGRMIIVTSKTGNVYLIDQESGQKLHFFGEQKKKIKGALFSPSGNWVAAASKSKNAYIFPAALFVSNKVFNGHEDQINKATINDTNEFVATASKDKTVRIWDIETGKSTVLNGHSGAVLGLAFHPSDEIIASSSIDKTLKTWTLDGENLQTFDGHSGSVNDVSFSQSGNLLVSASDDKTVRIWDHNTGKLLNTLEGHQASVTDVSFSLNGETIYSSSKDQTIRVWNRETGKQITLLKQQGDVNAFDLSPDGKYLASALSNKTVAVWDLSDVEKKPSILKHNSPVTSVGFSRNSKFIITGGLGKTSQIWDISSVQPFWHLENDKAPVLSAELSMADGWALTTEDKDAKLWRILSGPELFFYVKSILPRCLSPKEVKNIDLDPILTKWCVGKQVHSR